MSTDGDFRAGPTGPPWSVDVLADLHAGVYEPEVAAELRRRIGSDPEALAVLAALDSTVDDLSLLPPIRMPEQFAHRLDAAIATESRARSAARQSRPTPVQPLRPPSLQQVIPPTGQSGPAQFRGQTHGPGHSSGPPGQPFGAQFTPRSLVGQASGNGGSNNVVSINAARSRRNRWLGGLVAAAAVVAIGTVTVTSLNKTPAGNGAVSAATQPSTITSQRPSTSEATGGGLGGPPAQIAPSTQPITPNALELTPGRFQEAYPQIKGKNNGPLANPKFFAGCMAANNIVGSTVLGVTEVTFKGQKASAIAVAEDSTHARIVVVGLNCGVDGSAAYLDAETVTR
jgi:hypothetical protein